MTNKYDYSGKIEYLEEAFGSTREHMEIMMDELAERIKGLDEFTVVVVGRKGNDVEVTHVLAQNQQAPDFMDIRQRTQVLAMGECKEVHSFMETARHILHIDAVEFEDENNLQTVLDIGNSEGDGHSFSISHKTGE